jgi:hypothetical protein
MGVAAFAVSFAASLGTLLTGFLGRGWVVGVRLLARQGKLPALVAASLPRVVIVGDGGAGKSTILKQMLARTGGSGKVPVWVPLASLPTDRPLTPATLVDHLVRQAREVLGLDDVNDAFFRALVDEGRLTLGFDALDECGSLTRRQKVRGLIAEVAREWKRCQVFVTSRSDALRETPLPLVPADKLSIDEAAADRFFAFEPVPFSRDDVAPFLKAAFDDDGKLAQTLLLRTGIEALLETPLTLTLIGLVARSSKAGLPATRTPLFAQCLKTVCETWEDAKAAHDADGLDPQQRLDVLRRLGWEAQQVDGDLLGARAARRALTKVPAYAARAEVIVNGLARRNLLLRAESSELGEVQQIRFSHPQFREYLAGAHLAEQFALDDASASAQMAPHWFDIGWLEVLRFAIATVENDADLRDGLLRAISAADDPYRDLLHRPEFLVARLAARLPAADAEVIVQSVGALERAALYEPALRDEAARLLLGLAQHESARPVIRRFAQGDGMARAFPEESDSDDVRLESFGWRLRAIEALAQAGSRDEGLALLLARPTPGLQFVLEVCELRWRLGDREGALARWKACFDREGSERRRQISVSMDSAGEGAQFDAWLRQCLADGSATVSDTALARQRKIEADYTAVWSRLFETATKALNALGLDETFAPSPIADAVYAALDPETIGGNPNPAQRALVAVALRHPAFTWLVGGNVRELFPELQAEAIAQLKQYVLRSLASTPPVDRSRVGVAVRALCDEPNDGLAVPALRDLLGNLDTRTTWSHDIAASLARRGHALEALRDLEPILRLPEGTDDRHPDPLSRGRQEAWQLANTLDAPATRKLLDFMYRSGDPQAAAERLIAVWYASGVVAVARGWFAELAKEDEGRRFLQILTRHERDTSFSDEARHALYGSVFDDGNEESPAPWTLADHERAFEDALAHGFYFDKRDEKKAATVGKLLRLLGAIAVEEPATATRHADAWVQRSLLDESLAPDEKAQRLAAQLQGLAQRGLGTEQWVSPVAAFARTLAPNERVGLIKWLNATA